MKKKKKVNLAVLRACGVFLISFLILTGICHLLLLNQRSRETLKASYTAQETVRRIETKLDKYLTKSELFKRIIESGDPLNEIEFYRLSGLMMDEEGVLQAIEMAKDGTVNLVYPLKGNEEAMGLDVLTHPERKAAAALAKTSGKYTIAGPFELVQGGKGALLFDPIYQKQTGRFWGFSILVIDWDAFVRQLELENLENAAYHYRIWRMDGDQKLILAQGKGFMEDEAVEVECAVPNDVWYFEIMPAGGWISQGQVLVTSILCTIPSLLVACMYWQDSRRRKKEAAYAKRIRESAERVKAASDAKTRFLFNMSHDIRTPMNAIIGFSDLLKVHLDEPVQARNYVEKIRSSGAVLQSLLNQVLEMARIESGTVSLNQEVMAWGPFLEELRAVFESSIAQKHLRAETELHITDEYIWADKTKLREVLLNVISNAVKYTLDGGSLRLSVWQVPAEKEKEVAYEIRVEDSGIGMSDVFLPHLFEKFSREYNSTETKIPGTGLGMPIVKSLVEHMGGAIYAESTPGRGTAITICLSFQPASQENGQGKYSSPMAKQIFGGKRVLVAEDNELNAEITMTILRENGMEAERAPDGEGALQMVQEHPEGWYDLILMDVQMPGMDGYMAAMSIRKLPGSRGIVPILAMTANAFASDRKKALESGMNGHIAKPIGMEKLLEEMEKWL